MEKDQSIIRYVIIMSLKYLNIDRSLSNVLSCTIIKKLKKRYQEYKAYIIFNYLL